MYRFQSVLTVCIFLFLSGLNYAQHDMPDSIAKEIRTIRQLVDDLHLEEAHKKLNILLGSNNPEAKFELARMLLVELKWARSIITGREPSAVEAAAIQREKEYYGFVRRNGRYKIYSSGPTNLSLPDIILTYWTRSRCPVLLAQTLEDYVEEGGSRANIEIAIAWLKTLKAASKTIEDGSRGHRIDSPESIYAAAAGALEVAQAIEAGEITVPPEVSKFDQKVYDTQVILKEIGYDVGTTDGIWGSQTRTAILMFQKDKGLTLTGDIDKKTIMMLRAERGKHRHKVCLSGIWVYSESIAREVLGALRSGIDFVELVRKYSVGPGNQGFHL